MNKKFEFRDSLKKSLSRQFAEGLFYDFRESLWKTTKQMLSYNLQTVIWTNLKYNLWANLWTNLRDNIENKFKGYLYE